MMRVPAAMAFLLLLPVLRVAGAADSAGSAVEATSLLPSAELEALIARGRAQLAADNAAEAVTTLRRAAERAPSSAEAHYRLGQALTTRLLQVSLWRRITLGREIGAAFRRAVELEPANAEYRYALFEFARHAPSFIGGGRRRAEEQAGMLSGIDPARGHRAQAGLYLDDDRPELAERELLAAVAAAPAVADHRFALGYYYQAARRWDEAFETFGQIARRFAGERQALFQIGKTAALSGRRLDEGARALGRYLRHRPGADDPPAAWAHYRLGQVYEHMGRRPAARAQYDAVLALDARHEPAREALAALVR